MVALRQFNFALLALLSMVCAVSAQTKSEIHEIYPVLQMPETSRDVFHLNYLNLESDGPVDIAYPTELAFTFRYLEKDMRMELRKNTQLLDSQYREIRMDYSAAERDGVPAESVLGNRVNCYYHGYLSSDPNSLVAVSACRGLSGMIHAHGQMFSIEPDLVSVTPRPPTHAPHILASDHLAPHHQDALQQTGLRHHLVVHDMDNLFNLPPLESLSETTASSSSSSSSSSTSTSTSAVFDRLFRNKPASPVTLSEGDKLVDEEEERELENNRRPTFCGVSDDSQTLEPSEEENSARATAEQREATEFLDSVLPGNRLNENSVFSEEDGTTDDQEIWRGVRLLIANDHALYHRLGDDVEASSLAIANIVSRIYVQAPFQTRTFVKLVGQVTYTTKDPFDKYFFRNGAVSIVGSTGLLNMFSNYQDDNANLPSRTNLQLYSGLKFESTILGLAGVGTMCDPSRSTAVCQVNQGTSALNAVVSAHEMGHNLGMLHDGSGNSCPKSGFVMASYAGSSLIFSRCSQLYYQRYMGAANRFCMGTYRLVTSGSDDDKNATPNPTLPSLDDLNSGAVTTLSSRCGDGIVDAMEQCDCGASNCTLIDPCCDGNTCRLVSGAQCSANDACCTPLCTIVPGSVQKVCRASHGECDAEEQCDGTSAACPVDGFKASGTQCTPTAVDPNTIVVASGMCMAGVCMDYPSQCTSRGLVPCHMSGLAPPPSPLPLPFPLPPLPTPTPSPSPSQSLLVSPTCSVLYCAPNAVAASFGACMAVANTDYQTMSGVPCYRGDDNSNSSPNSEQCYAGDCVLSSSIHPVQANWVTGEWTSCSALCGGGRQTRVVQCVEKSSSRQVDPRFCKTKAPAAIGDCNIQKCHAVAPRYGWRTGVWSPCDVPCGTGYQTRSVQCVDLIDGVPVSPHLCGPTPSPAQYQFCKIRQCANHHDAGSSNNQLLSAESPLFAANGGGGGGGDGGVDTNTNTEQPAALHHQHEPTTTVTDDSDDTLSVLSVIALAACPAALIVSLILWCAWQQEQLRKRSAALIAETNSANVNLIAQP